MHIHRLRAGLQYRDSAMGAIRHPVLLLDCIAKLISERILIKREKNNKHEYAAASEFK